MKDLGKDILSSDKENFKKMPFTTPEGYFENFRMDIRSAQTTEEGRSAFRISDNPIFRKLSPYLAMAAMFAVIAAAGTALMKVAAPMQEIQENAFLAYADLIPLTEPEAIYYSSDYDYEEISDEDIVNYLIYSGTNLENFE